MNGDRELSRREELTSVTIRNAEPAEAILILLDAVHDNTELTRAAKLGQDEIKTSIKAVEEKVNAGALQTAALDGRVVHLERWRATCAKGLWFVAGILGTAAAGGAVTYITQHLAWAQH